MRINETSIERSFFKEQLAFWEQFSKNWKVQLEAVLVVMLWVCHLCLEHPLPLARQQTHQTILGKLKLILREIGQFQKIPIPNHGRLPCFNTPLPSEIPKCVTPPCPQNSIIVNPPSPSEFPFFWKYIFDLATPIWTNEHEFMPPQGCDLAAPGDKLYSSVTRKNYR